MRAPRLTSHLRARVFSFWVLIAVHFMVTRAPGAVMDPLAEYRIKAAYLYNFTKFIEWPPAAFADDRSPYFIGILERDTTVSTVMREVLSGKTTVSGRTIELRTASSVESLTDCHIIFVTRDSGIAPNTIGTSTRHPILVVGEISGFAQTGGTINFLVSGDLIRLEINALRADHIGLRLSGTLASIGTLVRDREEKP